MLTFPEADFTANRNGLEIAVLKDILMSDTDGSNYIDLTANQTLLLTHMLCDWRDRWLADNACKFDKMQEYKQMLALMEAE